MKLSIAGQSSRHSVAFVAVCLAVAGASWAVLSGQAPVKSLNRLEYGEFRVEAERAVLVTTLTVQEIKPPEKNPNLGRSTVYENSTGRFTRSLNLKLYYHDVIGAEGWELLGEDPLEVGRTYLVRRRT